MRTGRFFCLFTAAFLACAALSQAKEHSGKIIHRENTLYQYLAVIEDSDHRARYLATRDSGYLQGGVFLDKPNQLVFEYTRMAFLGTVFLEKPPTSALFVGLGAGSMPGAMTRFFPETTIDIVEIDPAVERLARKYLFYKDLPKTTLHIKDGRIFIKKAKKKKNTTSSFLTPTRAEPSLST